MEHYDLAAIKAFAEAFETANKNGVDIVKLREGSPESFTEFVHELHDGALPSDSIYAEISHAADHLSGYDADSIEDAPLQIEPGPYYSEQKKWLSENPNAERFIDQAMQDITRECDFATLRAHAQAMYRADLASAILEHFRIDEAYEAQSGR